jgi:hypothetical protein
VGFAAAPPRAPHGRGRPPGNVRVAGARSDRRQRRDLESTQEQACRGSTGGGSHHDRGSSWRPRPHSGGPGGYPASPALHGSPRGGHGRCGVRVATLALKLSAAAADTDTDVHRDPGAADELRGSRSEAWRIRGAQAFRRSNTHRWSGRLDVLEDCSHITAIGERQCTKSLSSGPSGSRAARSHSGRCAGSPHAPIAWTKRSAEAELEASALGREAA